jgi:predicted TIM-barrel fold metal-dependent hydrolase
MPGTIAATALLLACAGARPPASASAERAMQPIIDVHFHAMWWGPEAVEPLTGFRTPKTPEELRDRNIAALKEHRVVRIVVSGDTTEEYRKALPNAVIPGVWMLGPSTSVEELRARHRAGRLAALAEFAPQYAGLAPGDAALAPYWALAAELDLPVGIHMGPGPPGAAYAGMPKYRMALSSPLLLEEVLVRHPKLRVYVMHAGWPMLDDVLGLLWAHPQVHVDVGVIDWALPRAEFHAYLRRLVEAGYAKRIMYGSDNMVFPDAFGRSIEAIRSAPFLSDGDRRDILCANAMRFLKLPPDTCE